MSVVPVRVQSAGRSGIERENWTLRDNILQLEQELTFTKAELVKVRNELQAVVFLIKRAWIGDNAAGILLAKFIGVAKPDFHIQNSGDMKCVKIVPKKHSINNWAKLAIGLLKSSNRDPNTESPEDSLYYLNHRQQYLSEQMAHNERPQRPRYRRPSGSSSVLLNQNQNQPSTTTTNLEPSVDDEARMNLCDCKNGNQTNCRRFLTNNLFQMEDISSGVRLKTPTGTFGFKSAAGSNGGRPLKYETTRPVSAQIQKSKPRAQSAKCLRSKPKDQTVKVNFTKCTEIDLEELQETVEIKRNTSPVKSDSDVEDSLLPTEDRQITKMKKNIKKPEFVTAFDKDLRVMAQMESDFKMNAVELQKKLGIDVNGMVFNR